MMKLLNSAVKKKSKWDMTYDEFYNSQINYYEKIANHINSFSNANLKKVENSTAKQLLDDDYKKFQDLKKR